MARKPNLKQPVEPPPVEPSLEAQLEALVQQRQTAHKKLAELAKMASEPEKTLNEVNSKIRELESKLHYEKYSKLVAILQEHPELIDLIAPRHDGNHADRHDTDNCPRCALQEALSSYWWPSELVPQLTLEPRRLP